MAKARADMSLEELFTRLGMARSAAHEADAAAKSVVREADNAAKSVDRDVDAASKSAEREAEETVRKLTE